ncbi:expressed unknown protein [Ectocarpus siliculosus]|uniref:Uncharacterized protein n=1 Tax=Ectocarpus siliculosus TaxID=2880 RepID=D7FZ91_ECTSI|nr:expressed unknown protein [Ectocarpus siliculosus]|eukprot:CBJ32708.1 expressed unknown protein [Ectocarpus siliculosus]
MPTTRLSLWPCDSGPAAHWRGLNAPKGSFARPPYGGRSRAIPIQQVKEWKQTFQGAAVAEDIGMPSQETSPASLPTMSPNSAPRWSVSAMAVAMMVMSASAASADMGRVANGADAEERFSAVDKAITWGYNGGRALQPQEEGTLAPAPALAMTADAPSPTPSLTPPSTMAAEEGQTVAPAPTLTMAANTEAPDIRRHLRDGAA